MPNHNTNPSPLTPQNPKQMHSTQRKTRRNPLSDRTNTIANSSISSSSSSSIKTTKHILSSAIKTLLPKSNGTQVSNSDNGDPVYASPLPKTPSLPGDRRREGLEPISVYTRRKSAVKSKLRGKGVSLDTDSSRDGVNKSEVVVQAKAIAKPPKKKKRKTSVEDVADYSLPQDFVEKQRAYFAEIDAFELSEEEASVDDLD